MINDVGTKKILLTRVNVFTVTHHVKKNQKPLKCKEGVSMFSFLASLFPSGWIEQKQRQTLSPRPCSVCFLQTFRHQEDGTSVPNIARIVKIEAGGREDFLQGRVSVLRQVEQRNKIKRHLNPVVFAFHSSTATICWRIRSPYANISYYITVVDFFPFFLISLCSILPLAETDLHKICWVPSTTLTTGSPLQGNAWFMT